VKPASGRRVALRSEKVKCSYCPALVKPKFLPGHETGCSRNPNRDANLPARERRP
jgi:hypothetical protein